MADKCATIRDVAKYCGVSIATVSRVVNSVDYPVSEETRKKVEKAVAELHFQPNVLGQYLQRGETNDIGVIVPNLTDSYYVTLVEALYNAFIDSNCNVALYISYRNPSYEEQLYRLLLQKRVKAIIVVPTQVDPKWLHEERADPIPVVVIGQDGFSKCHCVRVDYFEGGYEAGKYLLELGHRNIAVVGQSLSTINRRQRYEGFLKAIGEAEIQIPHSKLCLTDHERTDDRTSQFNKGVILGDRLFNSSDPPTAIFVTSDNMALGVMQAVHFRNISVPEQVSIMGFGNDAASGMVYPGLSTVNPCAYAVAQSAAEFLLANFTRDGMQPASVCITPLLTLRQSTGPATL
ncbi:MAG: LacI family DNA-binding transcriptional regulator [Oscillospiraceae bacterium]